MVGSVLPWRTAAEVRRGEEVDAIRALLHDDVAVRPPDLSSPSVSTFAVGDRTPVRRYEVAQVFQWACIMAIMLFVAWLVTDEVKWAIVIVMVVSAAFNIPALSRAHDPWIAADLDGITAGRGRTDVRYRWKKVTGVHLLIRGSRSSVAIGVGSTWEEILLPARPWVPLWRRAWARLGGPPERRAEPIDPAGVVDALEVLRLAWAATSEDPVSRPSSSRGS